MKRARRTVGRVAIRSSYVAERVGAEAPTSDPTSSLSAHRRPTAAPPHARHRDARARSQEAHVLLVSPGVNEWLAKNGPDLAAVLIGLSGLVIIVALSRLGRAKRLAGGAIDQAGEALVESQGPWLTAEIHPDEEGHVLEIIRQPAHVEVRTRIRLRNTGRSVAKNISLPEVTRIEARGPGTGSTSSPGIGHAPPIDLAPGASITQTATAELGADDLDALEADLRGDNFALGLGMIWTYESELDERQYKTRLSVRLRLNEGTIMQQDHGTVESEPAGNDL